MDLEDESVQFDTDPVNKDYVPRPLTRSEAVLVTVSSGLLLFALMVTIILLSRP